MFNNKNILPLVLLLGFSTQSFAYFCSGNNTSGYIEVGDPQAAVQTACGAPATIQNVIHNSKQFQTVQYWTYPINGQGVNANNYSTNGNTAYPTRNYGANQVVFEITDNKVTQISSEGRPTSSTKQCPTRMVVSVGDSSGDVINRCGQPTSSNTTQRQMEAKSTQTQVWTYNYGPYRPTLVLEFDANGRLSSVAEGQTGY